jgi:tryptophan synthase alpha chain
LNRIEAKFKELQNNKKKAFMPYICAGDPTLDLSRKLLLTLEKAGADLIEFGIPFSDPVADGPTIQKASERSLYHGTSLDQILNLVSDLRSETDIPITLMGYYNPIFQMGVEGFCQRAMEVGADGVIIVDLPPEEAEALLEAVSDCDLATIFLVAPTSTSNRIVRIAKLSKGFIYCVLVTGVTGVRNVISDEVRSMVTEIRKHTGKPICVGFGVSTPDQAKRVAQIADGVIVGSAIVKVIEENLDDESAMLLNVKRFAEGLAKSVKEITVP